jgi:hypothetical protein
MHWSRGCCGRIEDRTSYHVCPGRDRAVDQDVAPQNARLLVWTTWANQPIRGPAWILASKQGVELQLVTLFRAQACHVRHRNWAVEALPMKDVEVRAQIEVAQHPVAVPSAPWMPRTVLEPLVDGVCPPRARGLQVEQCQC